MNKAHLNEPRILRAHFEFLLKNGFIEPSQMAHNVSVKISQEKCFYF